MAGPAQIGSDTIPSGILVDGTEIAIKFAFTPRSDGTPDPSERFGIKIDVNAGSGLIAILEQSVAASAFGVLMSPGKTFYVEGTLTVMDGDYLMPDFYVTSIKNNGSGYIKYQLPLNGVAGNLSYVGIGTTLSGVSLQVIVSMSLPDNNGSSLSVAPFTMRINKFVDLYI